jgi:hypothetical protein
MQATHFTKGSIDLWKLPQDIFDKIRRQNAPVRLTDYNTKHIIDNHYNEFAKMNKVYLISFVIFSNYTSIR